MNEAFHAEPARNVPLVEHTDVLVAGAGPAGVAAAVAAARAGAKVRLIEAHGQLGGVWTTGLLTWILDHHNKPGVMTEIMGRLEQRDARRDNAYDTEQMKLVLEQLCLEAGVDVRLHTRVVAAACDGQNRLAVAVTESKSGREAWAAKVFIDCTGDGDFAAQAGCGFDLGRPADGPGSAGSDRAGEMQPMSLMCLLTGVRHDELHALGVERGAAVTGPEAKRRMLQVMTEAGVLPSYGGPTLFCVHDDLHALMSNHAYGVSGMNAQELTDATLAARRELHAQIDALRSRGGPWAKVRIVATGAQIGVREGRRIRGRYTVSTDDMVEGRRHDDAVCRVTFGFDVHSTNKAEGTHVDSARNVERRADAYDIPLRALIASDCDGLLMAGRCISGDFLAHSSYRVTGNAVAMGEAAGRCAALAVTHRCLPHEVAFETLALGEGPRC